MLIIQTLFYEQRLLIISKIDKEDNCKEIKNLITKNFYLNKKSFIDSLKLLKNCIMLQLVQAQVYLIVN